MSTKSLEIACQDITSLCFHPDGAYFVTGDRSGSIRQCNSVDGAQLNLWTMNADERINVVAVSNDNRWLVSAGGETGNKASIWNMVTRECVVEVEEHTEAVCALDISNDSTQFASVSADNTIRIFDIASGYKLIEAPLRHGNGTGRDHRAVAVKFSPDASLIAITTWYSVQSGSPHRSHMGIGRFPAHYSTPVSVNYFTSVSVYNASLAGGCLFQISVKGAAWSQSMAWSFDGKQILVAFPGNITCIDVSTHSKSEWNIHGSDSKQVSILTSGNFIAYSTSSSISFWDHASREQIGQTIDHATPVNRIAVSRNARHLACVHDAGVTLHSLEGFIPKYYLCGVRCLPFMQASVKALKSLVQGNLAEAEGILSDEIAQRSNPTHDSLAICALIRMHLGEWKKALETAQMSLQVKASPIGRIARSIALIGAGEQEVALNELDFAFWDCDPSDIKLLLVVKSILFFVSNKRNDAIARLRYFIDTCDTSDGKFKDIYLQVLGMIYFKEEDYGGAAEILGTVKNAFTTQDHGPLMSLFIISNWNFENLKSVAWQRACERLYASGSVKEIGNTLLKMVSPLPEAEKERAHGSILQEIISRSSEVTLLAWTGKSSMYNSCLPSSPEVYVQLSTTSLSHARQAKASQECISKLQTIVPLLDALLTYGSVIRSQPVLFTQFRLLLPCIVFRVRSLKTEQENVYHAETVGLGNVTFTTTDSLPIKQPRKLVFVNPWIDHLRELHGTRVEDEDDMESNAHGSNPDADIGSELVHEQVIEEVPAPSNHGLDVDIHTRALELIARLGRPFSGLLLLKQSDDTYKRVAADHEIVIHGIEDNVLKNIRVEVLEVR